MQTKCGDGSVMICGFVGKGAETRRVGEKNSVLTKFSVKVGDKAVKGQEKKQAIWVNCTCWNDIGKAASVIKKGDYVLAVGKIQKSTYTDEEGHQRESSELICEFVTAMFKDCLPTIEKNDCSADVSYTEEKYNDDLPF